MIVVFDSCSSDFDDCSYDDFYPLKKGSRNCLARHVSELEYFFQVLLVRVGFAGWRELICS